MCTFYEYIMRILSRTRFFSVVAHQRTNDEAARCQRPTDQIEKNPSKNKNNKKKTCHNDVIIIIIVTLAADTELSTIRICVNP